MKRQLQVGGRARAMWPAGRCAIFRAPPARGPGPQRVGPQRIAAAAAPSPAAPGGAWEARAGAGGAGRLPRAGRKILAIAPRRAPGAPRLPGPPKRLPQRSRNGSARCGRARGQLGARRHLRDVVNTQGSCSCGFAAAPMCVNCPRDAPGGAVAGESRAVPSARSRVPLQFKQRAQGCVPRGGWLGKEREALGDWWGGEGSAKQGQE